MKISVAVNGEVEPIEQKSIASIVASDYRSAKVFARHRVDFCCGGKKSLEQVCTEKNLDINHIKSEIESATTGKSSEPDFQNWTIASLCSYIVMNHHDYVKTSIPTILQFAEKVARVHGGRHPETIDIYNNFNPLANELLLHMQKEEHILFPAAEQMELNKMDHNYSLHISAPIIVMLKEHDDAGELIHRIESLSGNYMPPADACNTYKALYAELCFFADDLYKHIHLENNILFPKLLELEKSFH